MAYLVCREAFGFQQRKPTFRERLKATLFNNRKKIASGLGSLALAKLALMNRKRNWIKKAEDAGWTKKNDNFYVEKFTREIKDKNGNVVSTEKDERLHPIPNSSVIDAASNLILKNHGYHESYSALVPGTMVMNEGIIDDAKEKISNFAGSVKDTVQRNVGNIANGINYITSPVRNFASGVADRLNNAQQSVSNFASNVVGSKNVKPVQHQPAMNGPVKVRPVRSF